MKRSKFSLSHYKLLTCDMGELVPCGLVEVLPGDSVQQATSMLVRVSPLVAPVMHPVTVRVHHWFVPHRLVWEDWEDFITGGPDGNDASVFPTRVKTVANSPPGGLLDYYGIPPDVPDGFVFSALPHRGYHLIWNEWYRDQDLQTESLVETGSGADSGNTSLMKVAWEKDYFTSARPWTQKGPSVTVPMGINAPVVPAGSAIPTFTGQGVTGSALNATVGTANASWSAQGTSTGPMQWATPSLQADLTNAQAANINELRTAFALQRYAEARARYGSRYTEYLRYLGVRSSDARLQRPEYLGGGKQVIQFSEILQTAPGISPDSSVVGELKGHGIGAMRSNRYRRFFEEHGYIHSLLSIKPKTMYGQSVARTFCRRTKEDFFQKELQHVGQQEVMNQEVYGKHANPTGVFGYQDRYDEYRRCESTIAADFRTTMDHWHYARMFAADPVLNGAFVACDATKRVNAVQSEDVLWIMCNHSIQARRMVDGSGRSFIL